MNYIVIDLEFNQAFDFPTGQKTIVNPKCAFEIIQIGCVKLDSNLNEIARQSFMIKPQIYTRMHPFVEKITGITMNDLKHADHFEPVYDDFTTFIGKEKYIFCVWGSNDIKALYNNILFYNLNSKIMSRKYINVQQLATEQLKYPSNNSIGLKSAVEAFGLACNIDFHNALNDAIYTSEIFKIIKKTNMTVQTFNLSQFRQHEMTKAASLNSGLLFIFAERELKRKLNDKEKEALIKVYNAGKSRKFDVHRNFKA